MSLFSALLPGFPKSTFIVIPLIFESHSEVGGEYPHADLDHHCQVL